MTTLLGVQCLSSTGTMYVAPIEDCVYVQSAIVEYTTLLWFTANKVTGGLIIFDIYRGTNISL